MTGIQEANHLRGISAATAHSFSQIRWCVLAVTWTLCANTVIEREKDRQRQRKWERPPQALLPLASLGIFSVKLFADSLWSWVPEPTAADGSHPPTHRPPYMFWTPLAVGPASEVEGRRGTKSRTTQSDMNQAGNSSLMETLHHFHLDLQPTAHRWKVDWEKARGQTGRRTNSGQTQHLSHNHSHTIESWHLESGDAMTILYGWPSFKKTSFNWIKIAILMNMDS